MKSPHMIAIGLLFQTLVCVSALAQVTSAVPEPAAGAPPGNVLRPGHLGRETGDLERIIHFYHDLLGTDLRGERRQPLPFWSSPGLIEFANSPKHAEFRAVILPIPGTAAVAGQGAEMTIEAIEFRNIERHQYVHNLQDIGSSHLVLILRDLDAALERLKADGVPVITTSGVPLEVPLMHDQEKKMRAVVVRDPDGYPVELEQLSPPPSSTAPADSNILGARVSLTVKDLKTTHRLYQSLVGPDLAIRTEPAFTRDEAYNKLRNTPGAEFRYSAALIPGSPVSLEFIQYRHIEQKSITPRLQDIGVGHILFMVKDLDTIMPRIRIAGLHTLNESGEPVFITQNVRAVFVTDPNHFFIEFMQRVAQ